MGAISLTTGKSFSSDEMDKVQKRKKVDNLEERLNDEEPEPVTKKRKVISAIPGRRGRPAKNIVKPLTSSSAEVSPLISVSSSATPASTSSVPSNPFQPHYCHIFHGQSNKVFRPYPQHFLHQVHGPRHQPFHQLYPQDYLQLPSVCLP